MQLKVVTEEKTKPNKTETISKYPVSRTTNREGKKKIEKANKKNSTQIHKTKWSLKRLNTKRTQRRQIIIKLSRLKVKEKIMKKKTVKIKETIIEPLTGLPSEVLFIRREWDDEVKVLKEIDKFKPRLPGRLYL